MRKLTLIVIVLAGLYSGYWFIGASATERAMSAQLDDMNASGWTVAYSDLSTAGFPSRFDTSVTDVDVKSPNRRTTWAAPFLQALSLSYKPNEAILAFPNQQVITQDGVPLTINSTGLRASVKVAATPALPLQNITAETGTFSIDGPRGTLMSISKGITAVRVAGPAPSQYDVFLDLEALTLPDDVQQLIDPSGALPASFDQFTIDGSIHLDAPLDRNAASETPRPTKIALNGMTITWGGLQLRGKGEIDIDGSGMPTGRITITAQNWRDLITVAVNAGLLDQGVANTAQNMGALLSGGSAELSVPVTFKNGRMSLGPLPIGPAPRFF